MRELSLGRIVAAERSPNLSWIANMTVSWTLAGGVAGGVLIAGLVLTSRLHSMGIILVVALVATFSSALGTVHGAVLGYLGRSDVSQRLRWHSWLLVGLAAAVAWAFAVVFAIWLALGAMAATAGERSGIVGLVIAAPVAIAIFTWATMSGWQAIETAYHRWPEHRLGTLMVVGAFVVLSASMLLLRGTIPGTDIRLSPVVAGALVGIAVLWIVSPAVIVALRFARKPRA
ncbi:MAG TPA: hypothetical protein VFO52_05435 [Longimicrobiales bacterium]|nr:hypothetical protein [Longimicrobiales bacterium]